MQNSETHLYYPDCYNSIIWEVSSLLGCVGYQEGFAEYCVLDGDGGRSIAVCANKADAAIIAKRLNGILT